MNRLASSNGVGVPRTNQVRLLGGDSGTTDNRPLELKVNGSRTLRLEPRAESPSIIAGHPGNTAADDVNGATIGGGGNESDPNMVPGRFGTVSGGVDNVIPTNAGDTVIGGGWLNRIEPACGYA
jgi:hypothetical protein